MKITYDKVAKAGYIKLRNTKITKTVKMTDGILFDVDKNRKIVGIEMLDVSPRRIKTSWSQFATSSSSKFDK